MELQISLDRSTNSTSSQHENVGAALRRDFNIIEQSRRKAAPTIIVHYSVNQTSGIRLYPKCTLAI